MDWRVKVGSVAKHLGLDAERLVARAEPLVAKLAPLASDVARRLAADQPADASTSTKPHVIAAHATLPFDITGLGITAEDAHELARIPALLRDDSNIYVKMGSEKPTPELTEAARAYVAGTTPSIFATAKRVDANFDAIAKRSGFATLEIMGLWNQVTGALAILHTNDRKCGTDLAASTCLAMLASWDATTSEARRAECLGAVKSTFNAVAESPRSAVHAARLFERMLAFSSAEGWPSALFWDCQALDSLDAIATKALSNNRYRRQATEAFAALALAMVKAPVTEAEQRATAMNPHTLRAELGKRAVTLLAQHAPRAAEAIGKAAVAAAQEPLAKPSAEELRELGRAPRWLMDWRITGFTAAYEFARTKMTKEQVSELRRYVLGMRGDLGQLGHRLSGLLETPSTRDILAEHFGVEIVPPEGAVHTSNVLSEAAAVRGNLQRSLRMLAAYDEAHATRHAVPACLSLLDGRIVVDGDNRDLVSTMLEIIVRQGSAGEQRAFVEKIPELIAADAWGVRSTQRDTTDLLYAQGDAAKADSTYANTLVGVIDALLAAPGRRGDDPRETALNRYAFALAGERICKEIGSTDLQTRFAAVAEANRRVFSSS